MIEYVRLGLMGSCGHAWRESVETQPPPLAAPQHMPSDATVQSTGKLVTP